jgi:hypothetical protein
MKNNPLPRLDADEKIEVVLLAYCRWQNGNPFDAYQTQILD